MSDAGTVVKLVLRHENITDQKKDLSPLSKI